MHFKTLIINTLIAILFISCNSEVGQFTILEGTVTDIDGNPITSGSLTISTSPPIEFFAFSALKEEFPIENDGKYSYSFFNGKGKEHRLSKNADLVSGYGEPVIINLDERNEINFVVERVEYLAKYKINHPLDQKPDSLRLWYELIRPDVSVIKAPSFSYTEGITELDDTTTEFIIPTQYPDSVHLFITSFSESEMLGLDSFKFKINQDTILLESNF